jgi:hypothetical protein
VTQERVVGRVAELWLYPVRSLAGAAVASAEVTPQGLAGDRAWTVVDPDGRTVRAKDEPALSEAPGAGDPAEVTAALRDVLGRDVRLVPTPGEGTGVEPVHLVSRQAIARAALGDVPPGCSADDPRANVLLDLDLARDGDDDERAWVGRTLQVGGALLEITRTPKHCLGVYAQVRRAGTVTAGDAVLL